MKHNLVRNKWVLATTGDGNNRAAQLGTTQMWVCLQMGTGFSWVRQQQGAAHRGIPQLRVRLKLGTMAHNWVRLQLGEAQLEAEQLGSGQLEVAKLGAATALCGYIFVHPQLVQPQLGEVDKWVQAPCFLYIFYSNIETYRLKKFHLV
jgi:hypothetical protein